MKTGRKDLSTVAGKCSYATRSKDMENRFDLSMKATSTSCPRSRNAVAMSSVIEVTPPPEEPDEKRRIFFRINPDSAVILMWCGHLCHVFHARPSGANSEAG